MSVNTNQIQELRSKTGAGILDCKKSLEESNFSIADAILWLRKKGLSSASKKAHRDSNEGVIATYTSDKNATIIALSAETDFVGKNEKFLSLAHKIVRSAHDFEGSNVQDFLKFGMYESTPVAELIANHIAIIGENIVLKTISKITVEKGKIISYLHNKLSYNIGKIGVLIALEGEINNEIEGFGKNLAMHIAASNPVALNIESIDQNIVQKERNLLMEQALESGKQANVADKIVEGRMKKFFEQSVLLEQPFILDSKTKVKKALEGVRLKNKCDFSILSYVRLEIGK